MKWYNLLFCLLLSASGFSQAREMGSQDSTLTSCLVIEKPFVQKNGKVSKYKEIYFRCSVQDYFIKFCESEVTKKQMKKYINKGISVVMEIREGSWDICEDSPQEMQSRIGKYVVIHSIEKH